MDARLEPEPQTAGGQAMKLRRRLWWYVAAALYIGACLSVMPYIERFYSPFPIHVFGGPQ